ncbi:MFS transporter [Shimazuella kribbensis]|uniref:MFS transporter n=1 Tax=Shimazuella kribbensis TaxID=139808 RepID=UPI00041BEC22|nr:MFS transporter [Shimazuella kribbensis]
MHWLRLVPLMVGQMIIIVTINDLIGQALHILLDEQGMSVGLIMSSFLFTCLICGLLFGRVTDRYGAKKLVLIFLPILTGMIALYPLAHTTREYMIVRILIAIVFSLVVNAFTVLMRTSLPSDPKFQAQIHGYRAASTYVGSGIAMFFGLQIADKPFLLWFTAIGIGAVSVLLVFGGIALVSDMEMTLRERVVTLIKRAFLTFSNGTKRLIERDSFFITLPVVGISACYLAFLTYFSLYVGKESAGLILFTSTVANGIASITVIPKVVVSRSYRSVMGWSILILIGSLILIRIGRPFWLLLVAGMMIGIVMAASSLSLSEEINKQVQRRQLGAGYATSGFLRGLGAVIGTIYAGVMWGILRANMWVSLIPLLVISAFLLYWIESKTHKKELSTIQQQRDLFRLKYQAAFEVTKFERGSSSDQKYLKEIQHLKQQLADDPKESNPDPEVLVHETKNIALALCLLEVVGSTGNCTGRYTRLKEMICQLRRRLTDLLEQIDRENIQNRMDLGTWWNPETSVQEYQTKLEYSNLVFWSSRTFNSFGPKSKIL